MAKLIYRIGISGRALLATRPGLAVFLDGLPHLNLSTTGRRNVCARFALSDVELSSALAETYGQKGGWL